MTKTKKKILVMCIALTVTVLSFFCGTLAYFTDFATAHQSKIATGITSVEIIDVTEPDESGTAVPPGTPIRIMPGYQVGKTVSTKNTGNLPLYIRVQLSPEITLAENARGRETEIDLSLVSYDINLADWMEHEGYYYYRTSLAGGAEAVPLFTKVIFSEEMGNLYKDSTILLKVRVEVVQANSNADSAIDAYGWSEPAAEGGGV